MKTSKFFFIFCFFVLLIFSNKQAMAQDETTLRNKHFYIDDKVALQGYDAVSYFDNKPQEGNKKFSYMYLGVSYLFVNQANMEKFKQNPSKYEPAYGGWCAYAIGKNAEKVEPNTKTFKIKDGRLLLFYNAFFNNTLDSWNKDESALYKKSDANWKIIYK